MDQADAVRKRYEEALESFVEKARRDPQVVGVVLLGSLSYDVVWEQSDIDLYIILEEMKRVKNAPARGGYALVENGINIHATPISRSAFKQTLEGAVGGSFLHSLMSKGKIVYSRDETIDEIFEDRHRLGARDRAIRMLQAVQWVLPGYVKAQKWLRAKNDPLYAAYWILKCVDGLATIEVTWNHEIPGREVVHQALRHNPALFDIIYTGLLSGAPTSASVSAALNAIQQYLMDRAETLFEPILDYLREAEGARSASEINRHFESQMNLSGMDGVCEWLAEQDIIQKVSSPLRLTEKSRVDMDEAAYSYAG